MASPVSSSQDLRGGVGGGRRWPVSIFVKVSRSKEEGGEEEVKEEEAKRWRGGGRQHVNEPPAQCH